MNNVELNKLHYLAQKYNEYNLPLYLSYPVERKWREFDEKNIIGNSLKNIKDAQIYLHFPFCKSICYYCCCDKTVSFKDEDKDRYIDYVEKELDFKLSNRSEKIKADNIHWGGGTPTYMNLKQIARLNRIITDNFEISDEARIKIEAYPNKQIVTLEKLNLLREQGFNYISFGIQDFDKRVQKAINRDCSLEDTKVLVNMAKKLGFIINIDLCYGLPFQGLGEFEKTLKEVINIEPDKIVIYPYAHFPTVYSMQRNILQLSIPNNFIKGLLFKMANQYLSGGYKKTGIDTFIRYKGKEGENIDRGTTIRDFMGSSEETSKHLVGIGSAAVSKVDNVYYKNVSNIECYYKHLDEDKLPIEVKKVHCLSEDDLIREAIIQKCILGNFEINKDYINDKFHIDFDKVFHKEIELLKIMEKDGLLEGKRDNVIQLTDVGSYFARTIAHVFDKYY
ncbi:oxygen-independent coproporphyrinogen III oxidase [Clostridium estertheticum]|uniref:oxygen-independent coproporphyrinogen III oxidase n=1 Tax=Clostridium estertheticum TaxID=238834 RepID=UPI0013EEDAF6|nr:oxygen-independent coproporphyrinogen III oxidase [Clostridium estertheticum]MBZ9609062.1 oxygen-independent coproporphyrinogen III oxidase [Clostridium estertheticum]